MGDDDVVLLCVVDLDDRDDVKDLLVDNSDDISLCVAVESKCGEDRCDAETFCPCIGGIYDVEAPSKFVTVQWALDDQAEIPSSALVST